MLSHSVLRCGRNAPILMVVRTGSTATARRFEDIPGPKPIPILGNTWRFMPIIGEFYKMDFNEMQTYLHSKYGQGGNIVKLEGIKGRKDWVFMFNPDDVEQAFRNEGPWPIRDSMKTIEYYRGVLRKDFFQGSEGLLTTQGEPWQNFRTRVNQPMMQPRNTKIYVEPIDKVAKEFIDRMRVLRNNKQELPENFIQDLNKWALESIAIIALDARLGCLQHNLPKDSEPQKMIDAVHLMFEAVYQLDLLPKLRHFTKYKIWHELVIALDTFNEVSMKYINQALIRIQNRSPDDTREFSVLERLLLNNDNPKVATIMALDMLMAGIDTTSNAVGVLMHYLARDQKIQQKLFEELIEILPNKDQTITAKNLEDMKYLKACVKESMRITPIAGGNVREMVKDVVLGNYLVPKGKDVVMCHMQMSNSEKHFAHPERFIPERWLKGDELQQKSHPFVFMPFGFGPRMCVGRRFAELEMETLIAKVVRNFRLEYDQELKIKVTALSNVVSPLNIRIEDRRQ